MIRDGITYRLISDHLGSVRLVVNAQSGTNIEYIIDGRNRRIGRYVNDS